MRIANVFLAPAALILIAGASFAASADEFTNTVRPVLEKHCAACHSPDDPKSKIPFLKAKTAQEVSNARGLWLNVATQLQNRTMPPVDPRPSEDERFQVATWIKETLRETACQVGDFAGDVTVRRLNRREYDNTIRDLFGLKMNFSETFPMDGSGGEGFDNNGETLYLPPLLLERYLEAAQTILDAAVITPSLDRSFAAADLLPARPAAEKGPRRLSAAEDLSALISIYVPGDYIVTVSAKAPEVQTKITLKVDGIAAENFTFNPPEPEAAGRPASEKAGLRLTRGLHALAVAVSDPSAPIEIVGLKVEQGAIVEPGAAPKDSIGGPPAGPPPAKSAVHHRLLGAEPGETRLRPREDARHLLTRFLPKAFRRPIEPAEVERFLALYDRAAERGDPFEERVKLALKGVLVSSDFLFRVEKEPAQSALQAVPGYEMATRLSYFLWSTMPDDELFHLAREGRLQDPRVLAQQVDRMLDDPKSRILAETFIGQWLGTKDVGGRVAPTVNAIQDFYTPEIASDMRQEPILMFQHLLDEDRGLLDFLESDYTFITGRLAAFYGLEGAAGLPKADFQQVALTNGRRGGVLGFGGVLAMTSHFEQTSPVLRGAWVLETLLGTPVPTPPPDVPELNTKDKDESGMTVRQIFERHRADISCSACHNIMDPIGFALENFDFLGRWRDQEENGKPIDATGKMVSGESFAGPAELRQVLLTKQEEFLRHITGKMLGYALGRSLVDEDQCTVQKIVDKLKASDYRARTLVREVALSAQFRFKQSSAEKDSSK